MNCGCWMLMKWICFQTPNWDHPPGRWNLTISKSWMFGETTSLLHCFSSHELEVIQVATTLENSGCVKFQDDSTSKNGWTFQKLRPASTLFLTKQPVLGWQSLSTFSSPFWFRCFNIFFNPSTQPIKTQPIHLPNLWGHSVKTGNRMKTGVEGWKMINPYIIILRLNFLRQIPWKSASDGFFDITRCLCVCHLL